METQQTETDVRIETTEDLIDRLGQEIMAMAVNYITRSGKGEKITDDEKECQKEAQEQHKILCSTYNRMQKIGRVGTAGANKNFDKQLTDKIRNTPTALGEIVQKAIVLKAGDEPKPESNGV